jgi:hypothetical protein
MTNTDYETAGTVCVRAYVPARALTHTHSMLIVGPIVKCSSNNLQSTFTRLIQETHKVHFKCGSPAAVGCMGTHKNRGDRKPNYDH